MIRTLRGRLTALNIVIVAAAVSLFAALLYVWLSNTLYAHHDQELADDARRIAEDLRASLNPLADLAAMDAAERVGPLFMVRDHSGRMLFRSARLASSAPDAGEHTALRHAAMAGPTVPQFFTVALGQGSDVRFVCLPLARPEGTYLQLGRRVGDVGVLLHVVRLASVILVPLVVLVTSFGGLIVARRALAPIGRIATTLESIQATDLTRRVDTGHADEEIGRLSGSINQLLDRLHQSFVALQDFSADVSHQLLTPLTIMKSGVDVARAASQDSGECQRILGDIAEEVDALTETVQDLSDFTRAGADAQAQNRERVDVTQVFEEAVDLIQIYAESRGIGCAAEMASDVVVWGNRIRLRQLVLNLAENAVQFTPEGGRVWLTLGRTADRAVLTVRDAGVGIPPDALPRVFDRRYTAGRRGAAGRGLGLALVKRIVDAHGGDIVITSQPGDGTFVRVELPLAAAT